MLNTNDQRWHHSAFEALQQARISILAWNFHQISIHTKTGRFRKHTEKKVMKAKHYFCFFFICGKKSLFAADWSTNDTELRLVQFLEGETIHRLRRGVTTVWLRCEPVFRLGDPQEWVGIVGVHPFPGESREAFDRRSCATWQSMDWAGCSPWWAK